MLDTEGVIEGIFGEAATGDLNGVMSWWAPELFLRAADIFHVAAGWVQHESSWYGDGWLRQRLGGGGAPPPPPLPVTPALAANGARFR
jgi:hypothetical protein